MENRIGEARRAYAETVGKFTQHDAAVFFGVSDSTYKKWEQGQGKMNGAQLRMIAAKYGVTADYLLMMESPRRAQTPEERLIALYRGMDRNGRAALMEQAEFLSARHPLNKDISEAV